MNQEEQNAELSASRELTAELVAGWLPERPGSGHKGTFGHVMIIAGAVGYAGAPKLCALGALRSGVGLVTVAVPEPSWTAVAAGLLEPVTLALPSTDDGRLNYTALGPALEAAESRDAVVMGPGITQNPKTRAFVYEFVKHCPVPLILDADALNLLASRPELLSQARHTPVITPHPGEMGRLAGLSANEVQSDRETVATRFARDHGCVVLLKGHGSLIAEPGGALYHNATGNAGMATGGTGDVLAGLVGGLLSQGLSHAEAAAAGAFVHGLAGDIAAERHTGRAMIASDLADCLGEAWRAFEPLQDTHE